MTRTERGLLSLVRIAEDTGLSKRSVQTAIAHLEKRRLISTRRESPKAITEFTVRRPWFSKRPSSDVEL